MFDETGFKPLKHLTKSTFQFQDYFTLIFMAQNGHFPVGVPEAAIEKAFLKPRDL